MKREQRQPSVTRRGFLGRSLATLALAVASRRRLLGADAGKKSRNSRQSSATDANPYAYDLDKIRKVDPSLIHYELAKEIAVPGDEPKRISLDHQGRLVTSVGKNLLTLSAEGNVLAQVAAADTIRSLAFGPEGRLYVGIKNRIQVFDPQGAARAEWPVSGDRNWISSLVVTENAVFAADAGMRVVLKLDQNGKVVGRIGEKNTTRNIPGLVVPSPYLDARAGSDGRLWVANPGRQRIEAYTPDGSLEAFWGEPSFAISGFCGCCNPAHFCLDADGRFITSEKGLPRIKVYSKSGEFQSVVAGPDTFPRYLENPKTTPPALDVAVDSSGLVYVADPLGGKIQVFRRKAGV